MSFLTNFKMQVSTYTRKSLYIIVFMEQKTALVDMGIRFVKYD